jgi:hypothetical protein
MKKALLTLPVLLLAACAMEINSPAVSLDGLPEGLHASATVIPGEVAQHEPFVARFQATNTTDETISIDTPSGCLVIPGVYRDGRRIPMRGSWWACTAAGARHTFAPGETRTMDLPMSAELYAEFEGDRDGAPAPRGTYSVRFEFEVARTGTAPRRPAVEAPLRVR